MTKSPTRLAQFETILVEMEALQSQKVIELARRLHPHITTEDIRNPHDFPELHDPDWHYEDGLLTGIQSVLSALRAFRREHEQMPSPSSPSPYSSPDSTPAKPAHREKQGASFRDMIRGVTALQTRVRRVPHPKSSHASFAYARKSEARQTDRYPLQKIEKSLKMPPSSSPSRTKKSDFVVSNEGTRVEGRRAHIAQEIVRRLRRGMFPIRMSLDLHGMTADQALEALERFVHTAHAQKEHCILIVHGKGEHSPEGTGVLRREMIPWLTHTRFCNYVNAFTTALPKDGGTGAMYVLLIR